MLHIDESLGPADLLPLLSRFWEASGRSIDAINASWNPGDGAPVFTIGGRYTARGWTEWTQGFQFGSELLQFDATGEPAYLECGRDHTIRLMAPHVSHIGVHDHGFNNVSTYGNLRRLLLEGRLPADERELQFYELALKISGAVQAARWSVVGVPPSSGGTGSAASSAPPKPAKDTPTAHVGVPPSGGPSLNQATRSIPAPAQAGTPTAGYIYSFNGPHSLFADTIRSLRSLALGHRLGHRLMGENDAAISLLDRLVQHARATAEWNVYFGDGRDAWDVPGRVAHESIFNRNDGQYRCPSTQQGYSPFSTWTRGLAWIILGYAEELEFLQTCSDGELASVGGREAIADLWTETARATCRFYIEQSPTNGIPYWDTGAPGLAQMGDYLDRPAEPFNDFEPVDSSAAAIACQGLMRFGLHLLSGAESETAEREGRRYFQAGLTVVRTLLQEPYLNRNPQHQGLLLHSVYHRPRGWDHVPEGRRIPCGESCLWGDYHLREAALLVQRLATDAPYLTFFGPAAASRCLG